jgi:mannose-6-phosphate isomerase-like protein (cupin superfamily)
MSSQPLKIYWFDGSQVQGPVAGIEIRELAFRGVITPETQVQLEGHGRWVDARKLKGLFSADGSVLPHPEETQEYLQRLKRGDKPPARNPQPRATAALTRVDGAEPNTLGARPRMTIANARRRLGALGGEFVAMDLQDSVEIEFYQPVHVDRQAPHDRDEVYVIAAGSGRFELNNEVQPVETGEVLFVPAGAAHRFLDFTDDFATWVIWITNRS